MIISVLLDPYKAANMETISILSNENRLNVKQNK